jgi:hypothetical protein
MCERFWRPEPSDSASGCDPWQFLVRFLIRKLGQLSQQVLYRGMKLWTLALSDQIWPHVCFNVGVDSDIFGCQEAGFLDHRPAYRAR